MNGNLKNDTMDINSEIKSRCYKILLEIDRVCQKAQLKYYIYAGTLLGAVRHQGFIPWDDDIDIVMFRKDYNEFVNACSKYLNSELFELETIETNPNGCNPWMKLHDKNSAFISGIRRDGAMEGINIDIFPIDNAPDDETSLKKRANYFDRMNYIYQWRFANHSSQASWKMRFFQFAITLIPPFNEEKFKKKYDMKIQEYNSVETKNVVYFSFRKYMRKVIPKTVFESTVYLSFEGKEFPAPGGWHEVLVSLYGENYMELPPEKQRVSVHGTEIIDLEHSWRKYKRGSNGYEKI